MYLPIGFTQRAVTVNELRDVQKAFLLKRLTAEQRAVVDACLSWIINQHAYADEESAMLSV